MAVHAQLHRATQGHAAGEGTAEPPPYRFWLMRKGIRVEGLAGSRLAG
jgi:hypothetical protein